MNIRLYFVFLITFFSCSVDKEDTYFDPFTDLSQQRFVGKILPADDGYWIITRSVADRNCTYCSGISFIDGIAYVSADKTLNKDAIGYFLDSETKNNQLWALTSSELLTFSRTLQSSSVLKAENNETFKSLTKDKTGKIWILTNNRIFSPESDERISFPNTIPVLDFEASRDQSFWISSTDTVYHWKKNSGMNKFSLREITGSKNNVSSIYGLKIDKNDSIWVNTSENVFKHHEGKWKVVKTDAFSIDNFKSVPFMDVDIFGNVWLAEKNYQAFTTLHCFNGVAWTSCKLYPPLESWITDIETVDGTTILVGTTQGLQKLTLP